MTIIIGKTSNLSKHLAYKINDCYLVSSYSAIAELKQINFEKCMRINLIFNNFQKSSLLNNLSNPIDYIQRSIMTTSEVLAYFKDESIHISKVLYTSSSSVYGNNILCKESDPLIPMSLHSSLKIANEKLIESFCLQNNIDYTICRIFNMYGGEDTFSIISKIISAANTNTELTLFNNGNAIRDFIHVSDVVKIYKKLLTIDSIKVINIGTSIGISIKTIIDLLRKNGHSINYRTRTANELKISTADIYLLNSLFSSMQFKEIDEYVLCKVEVKNDEK